MTRARGFTLLEVMVALAVFAVVAAMVQATLQRHVHNTRMLENRALAGWLADTALAELQLKGAERPGIHEDVREQGNRRWRVQQDIQATAEPQMRLVRVRVTELDSDDGGTELTGFVRAAP
ncbi:Bacterial type II secretion system protein I/J [compost metagenome]